jgi:hypothetical protein
MRIVLLVSELNELKAMVGDIGNAYLTAMTGELVYIVVGPEFGSQEGTLWLSEYMLRIFGAWFHEKLADTFRDFNFKPSRPGCLAQGLWYLL